MDKHLDGDMLCDYAEGALTPEARLAADAHLQGCAACRRELEIARGYFADMAALEPEPAPRDFLAKVHARLPRPSPWKNSLAKWLFPWKLVPAQIIGLCMLGVTGLLLYRMKDRVESAPAPTPAQTAEEDKKLSEPAPAGEPPVNEAPAAPEPKAAPAPAASVASAASASARQAKKAADRGDADEELFAKDASSQGALAKAAAKPAERKEIVASQAITSGSRQPGGAGAVEKNETQTLAFADKERESEAASAPAAAPRPSMPAERHAARRAENKEDHPGGSPLGNAEVTYVLRASPRASDFEAGLDKLGIRWSKRQGGYALDLPPGAAAGLEKFLRGYGALEMPESKPPGAGNLKATLRLQSP